MVLDRISSRAEREARENKYIKILIEFIIFCEKKHS
jgi:hypothetical protein